MDNFYNLINQTINNEKFIARTENGAIGYKYTHSALLDMNFKLASYRNKKNEIKTDVFKAYKENEEFTLKFLFFARDILCGAGEREFFRNAIHELALKNKFPSHLVKYIPEYGRWDDIFILRGTNLENEMLKIITNQIEIDANNYLQNKNISLLAKWMPSINTSSKKTRELAYFFCNKFNITPKMYRKILSKLRNKINIVESQMCSNKWDNINYENVPSKANALYKNAFLSHDYNRRIEYLAQVNKGEKTINAQTLYPHDIVNKYISGYRLNQCDITLESLWKNLPNIDTPESTIVVADGSGSMFSWIGDTKVTALSVANSLAIYFAERAKGQYKNKFITFSNNPHYVDLSRYVTLHDKLEEALRNDEMTSTDIEKVFNLILKTAVNNKLKQDEIPSNILIISDMEFNYAVKNPNKILFNAIEEKFNRYGYKLPKLIFWNVNSRTSVIPIKENDNGVILISGFSPNLMKMVMSNETDPYNSLVKVLNSERYNKITLK